MQDKETTNIDTEEYFLNAWPYNSQNYFKGIHFAYTYKKLYVLEFRNDTTFIILLPF